MIYLVQFVMSLHNLICKKQKPLVYYIMLHRGGCCHEKNRPVRCLSNLTLVHVNMHPLCIWGV